MLYYAAGLLALLISYSPRSFICGTVRRFYEVDFEKANLLKIKQVFLSVAVHYQENGVINSSLRHQRKPVPGHAGQAGGRAVILPILYPLLPAMMPFPTHHTSTWLLLPRLEMRVGRAAPFPVVAKTQLCP